jgi:hypothetical protein
MKIVRHNRDREEFPFGIRCRLKSSQIAVAIEFASFCSICDAACGLAGDILPKGGT